MPRTVKNQAFSYINLMLKNIYGTIEMKDHPS